MKSLPGNGLRQVITAAFLLFGVVFSLPGQTVTGTIAGTVLDPSGAAIPNAAITVTNEDTGIVRNSVATTDGVYTIPSLLPGKYTVEGKAQGFGTVQTKNVTVAVGSDTRVDLTLQVGSTTQNVVVTGAAATIETSNAEVSQLMDELVINATPLNNRDLQQLAVIQPGVQYNYYKIGRGHV